MILNIGVYERTGHDLISDRTFFFFLGCVIIWGLGGTAYAANEVSKTGWNPGWLSIIIFGLAIPILGMFIAKISNDWLMSFVGYNMIIIPFGAILSPIVNAYSPQLIRNAFLVTVCVTGIMMFLGTILPDFFKKLGAVLLLSLLGLVGVRILQFFIPNFPEMGIIDWVSAGIFSLYIGYDWYRANNVPKTLNNAVDIAISLYLDIVNLFLNILSIMGRKK